VDIEEEIAIYLYEYGNTKESDIISYGRQKFSYSSRGMKKVIDRMERDGKIHRVVHVKLKPPGVYLSIKEHVPLEIKKEHIRAQTEVRKAELTAYAHGERR